MTEPTLKSNTIRIIQIDPVINHLAAQEKFFKDLGIHPEIYNFPNFEIAKPFLNNSGGLFDLILIHETIINENVKKELPLNTTIAIVNASRRQFDEKIIENKINHIGSNFKKKWFNSLFKLENELS